MIIILWLTIAANLFSLVLSIQARRLWQKRAAELSTDALTWTIHRKLLQTFGLDRDLIERAITDLAFLHDQIYADERQHACPSCRATIPELKELSAILSFDMEEAE